MQLRYELIWDLSLSEDPHTHTQWRQQAVLCVHASARIGRRLDCAERRGNRSDLESSTLKTKPWKEGGGWRGHLSAALEPSTGLGVGSKGGGLEGQYSTQHTLCDLEEGPRFSGSGMPIWKPGVRPVVGRRSP